MHTDIKYTGTDEQKRKKAILDIKQWIGPAKFKSTSELVSACEPPMNRSQFRFMCELGGIQGYPVEVWADQLNVPQDPPETQPEA